MPVCAAHKRRRAGRGIGSASVLHVAKPPQRSNLSSIAKRVKSCPAVQRPSDVPDVPRIAAAAEERSCCNLFKRPTLAFARCSPSIPLLRLFAGSDTGGERVAAVYSLIGTAKLNGINPEKYLCDVLSRIADHPINRIEELLPWNLVTIRSQQANHTT